MSAERTTTGVPAARLGSRKFLTPAEAKEALAELGRCACAPGDQSSRLDQLAGVLRESGYTADLVNALDMALDSATPNPHVGVLWTRRLTSSKSWDRTYPEELDEWCKQGELGRRAVRELLRYGANRRKQALVSEILRRHGSWLKQDAEGWPLMGQALVTNGAYKQALSWMEDWETRGKSDMLVVSVVAHAMRGLNREQAAHPIIVEALRTAQPGLAAAHPELTVWAAVEEALGGELGQAAQRLSSLEPAAWDDDLISAYYLARGVLRVQEADPERRHQAFWHAYDRIRGRFRRAPVYRQSRMTRRLYRRCMWRMAVHAGYYRRAISSYWRAADSSLPLVPLCLIPGLQLLAPIYLLRWLRNPARRTS